MIYHEDQKGAFCICAMSALGEKKGNIMFWNSYMLTVLVQIKCIAFTVDRPSEIKYNGKTLTSYDFFKLYLACLY